MLHSITLSHSDKTKECKITYPYYIVLYVLRDVTEALEKPVIFVSYYILKQFDKPRAKWILSSVQYHRGVVWLLTFSPLSVYEVCNEEN